MIPAIEIDENSGFCFGVVTAIRKAEEQLDVTGHLYCLGDIVHNSDEVERLKLKGLETITHEQMKELHDVTVLLRAHGEPPETYELARRNNIEIIDATCPVVLQLQHRIKSFYNENRERKPQIVIYGKMGHAEVNGLVGQTNGEAIVVENRDGLEKVDFTRPIALYSQTTKSVEGFRNIVSDISSRKTDGDFISHDTICRQVANRIPKIREFAKRHAAILFVCGAKSSNGKILYAECKAVNPATQMVSNTSQIDIDALRNISSIGICGATSTPRWLMNHVKEYVEQQLTNKQ